MRFLIMHRQDEAAPNANTPSPAFIEAMGAFVQKAIDDGVMITGEGVHPSETGALVRKGPKPARSSKSGRSPITVVDGPFTEAKEVIGGFILMNAKDRAEAVEFAKRFAELFDDDVLVEVRQVVEFDEIPS